MFLVQSGKDEHVYELDDLTVYVFELDKSFAEIKKLLENEGFNRKLAEFIKECVKKTEELIDEIKDYIDWNDDRIVIDEKVAEKYNILYGGSGWELEKEYVKVIDNVEVAVHVLFNDRRVTIVDVYI